MQWRCDSTDGLRVTRRIKHTRLVTVVSAVCLCEKNVSLSTLKQMESQNLALTCAPLDWVCAYAVSVCVFEGSSLVPRLVVVQRYTYT